MKVLNEKEKKMRGLAMQTLVTGGEKEKSAAKKFLKDIGLSDETIEKIEGKKKKPKVEEAQMVATSPDTYFPPTKSDCDNLDKCPCSKAKTCTKKSKKMVKEEEMTEEIKKQVNSLEVAEQVLKNRNINWDKVEKDGNRTLWKKDGKTVGCFDPSYGVLKTGKDIK